MEFPSELCEILKRTPVDEGSLVSWNAEMEAFFRSSSPTDQPLKQDTSTREHVEQASQALQRGILECILAEDVNSQPMDDLAVRAAKTPTLLYRPMLQRLKHRIQASQYLLRWNIQIGGRMVTHFWTTLQSHAMLELYVVLLEQTLEDELARHASLLLFYATYSDLRTDETTQSALKLLVTSLHFPQRVLQQLIQRRQQQDTKTAIPVCLSLLRNIHNLLVSYPDGVRSVTKCTIDHKHADASVLTTTYASLLPDLLLWALEPPFPEERRADLVIEILGILYALRAPLSTTVVLQLLQLPDNPTSYPCKLSTVSLLMNASPTMELLQDATTPLLDIFQRQVDYVLEHQKVDSSGAAALVPILALLHKSVRAHQAVCQQVKDYIFPYSEEFLQLAATSNHNNMKPLDAPPDTLRYKCTVLMTWPESHIKRLVSELLWSLCREDAKEFVQRTGLGNALPTLSLKGVVPLPSQVVS